MRVVVGADRWGRKLLAEVTAHLAEQGRHAVVDLSGGADEDPLGPDLAEAVGLAILNGKVDRGILICASGVGMAIAANKIPGIRAANCATPAQAAHARHSSDAQVLVLASRGAPVEHALSIVDVWLRASFAPNHRRRQRMRQLRDLEARYSTNGTSVATPGRAGLPDHAGAGGVGR